MSATETPSDSDPRPQAELRLLTGDDLGTRADNDLEDEPARRSGALAHV